jgi:hypothetical protein
MTGKDSADDGQRKVEQTHRTASTPKLQYPSVRFAYLKVIKNFQDYKSQAGIPRYRADSVNKHQMQFNECRLVM